MSFNFYYSPSTYIFSTESNVNISCIVVGTVPPNTVFTILPNLPHGLFINSINGNISGNTSFISISPSTNYTVSAINNNVTIANTPITISVGILPKFYYDKSLYILKQNVLTNIIPVYFISNLSNTTFTSLPSTYPSLTDLNLILNTTTGVISGIPTTISSLKTFYIRANNNGITYDTSFNLMVQPIPSINYPKLIYNLTQGLPISIIPIFQTQYNVFYNISGCILPLGLNFNSTTGEISGTPTLLTTFQVFRITISNEVGSSATSLTINIIRESLAPPVIADNISSNIFLTNPIIAMRRKAEILQYKKNCSNLTKQQYLALLVKGNGPYAARTWANQGNTSTNPNIQNFTQEGNTLVCNSNSIICAPTSSSDVPGPIMNLCYNPLIPVIGYNPQIRTKTNIGFKWPQHSWRKGDFGFPRGKSGTG